jgi:cytochrome c oxidase subunit 4
MRFVIGAGIALLVLAGVSLLLSRAALGAFAVPVALAIAVLKASVVAAVFMEVARERVSIHVAVATGIGMLILLVGLTVADVVTREVAPLTPPRIDFEPRAPRR